MFKESNESEDQRKFAIDLIDLRTDKQIKKIRDQEGAMLKVSTDDRADEMRRDLEQNLESLRLKHYKLKFKERIKIFEALETYPKAIVLSKYETLQNNLDLLKHKDGFKQME